MAQYAFEYAQQTEQPWQAERNEYRELLRSMMLSMNVHPDCEEGSEFDDYAQSAQDLLDKYQYLSAENMD